MSPLSNPDTMRGYFLQMLRSPLTILINLFISLSLFLLVIFSSVILPRAELRQATISVWMNAQAIAALQSNGAANHASVALNAEKIVDLEQRVRILEATVARLQKP